MAYDDVRAMVEAASLGMPVSTWRMKASEGSRLLSGDRRLTQLRIANMILRPVDGVLADANFFRDFAQADEESKHDLIYARYLASMPLGVAVAQALFKPALRNGRTTIERHLVDAAIRAAVPETTSPATIDRSRTSFGTEFSRAGVVRVRRDGALSLANFRPSALAVFHVINEDLRSRREATDAWLATESMASALYAFEPGVVRDYIEQLVAMGRLQRSYYGGEPRVLAA